MKITKKNGNGTDRTNIRKVLEFLENRIEKHNRRIEQAIRDDNHNMKTIIKAERSEALTIRQRILDITK